MTQPNPQVPSAEIGLQENVSQKPETMTKIFFEKFFKNKLAVIGGILLLIIVLSALFAPLIAPYPPEQQNLMNKLKAPSAEHLMGTDKFGRDIFAACCTAHKSRCSSVSRPSSVRSPSARLSGRSPAISAESLMPF